MRKCRIRLCDTCSFKKDVTLFYWTPLPFREVHNCNFSFWVAKRKRSILICSKIKYIKTKMHWQWICCFTNVKDNQFSKKSIGNWKNQISTEGKFHFSKLFIGISGSGQRIFSCLWKLRRELRTKSLHRIRAGSHFYRTEYEIRADFGNNEKKWSIMSNFAFASRKLN